MLKPDDFLIDTQFGAVSVNAVSSEIMLLSNPPRTLLKIGGGYYKVSFELCWCGEEGWKFLEGLQVSSVGPEGTRPKDFVALIVECKNILNSKPLTEMALLCGKKCDLALREREARMKSLEH